MVTKINEQRVQHSLDVLNRVAQHQSEGKQGFEWPDFKSDRERIRKNTESMKHMSLQDSFAKAYGVKYSKTFLKQEHNDSYRDLTLGDIVPLYIQEVNKKGVVFRQDNIKETIVCSANLYQYPHFRDFLPTKPIECKVINRTNDKIVVDPFAGLFDKWIQEHTTNLQSQYHMYVDKSIEVSNLHLVRGGFIGRVRIDTISDLCGKDMFIEAFIPGSQIVLNIEYDFERWEGQSTRAFITTYSNKPYGPGMVLTCSAKEYLRHIGNRRIVDWFKSYCEDSKEWKAVEAATFTGKITGVCHTANKCGAFVELPQHITAMIPCKPTDLSSFKRGEEIEVKIDKFEEPTRFNGVQTEHLAPYIIEDDVLKKCYVRLILKQA